MSKAADRKEVFTLSYEFNAPKELVFRAFGDAAALNEWWGPVETQNSVISLDFRPGGIFHYKMEADGHTTYGRFLFRSIVPHDLLEFSNAFADEQGRVVKAPFDVPLPLEILYRITFTGHKDKTIVVLTGEPIDAAPHEIEGFMSITSGMEQGFGGTFAQLAAYLEKQGAV